MKTSRLNDNLLPIQKPPSRRLQSTFGAFTFSVIRCSRFESILLVFLLTVISPFSWLHADNRDGDVSSRTVQEQSSAQLLPDLFVPSGYLNDRDYSTGIVPGRRHLRFSNGTANIGAGKLHLYGVLPATSDTTQQINQRIFETGGGFTDQPSGQFLFHNGHSHIHVDNWCQYRIRTVLPGDGVGPIISGGAKVSFCILDLLVYNSSLPGFPPGGEFTSCASTTQGLSVGWVDVYHKELAGQNIDITDVPPGEYWLESEVDPANIVQESNESNNITRIKVTISEPTVTTPDRYEPNDSRAEVLGRVVGQINSPNLGPVNPQLVIDSLTLHTSTNHDYFRFYLNSTGTNTDFVKINFLHSNGDIDMALMDSVGTVLARSESVSDSELILLTNRPRGYYFIQIYGFNGALASWYKLTLNPPSNAPPTFSILSPPAGNSTRIYAVETYPITWTSTDPTNDDRWVTYYLDTIPAADGDEQLLSTSVHIPAANSPYLINSAGISLGRYHVYGTLTDGGTTVSDWSDGTVTFVLSSDARYLQGIVRGYDSLPLSGAVITVANEHRVDTTDANGAFFLGPFSTDSISVLFSHATSRDSIATISMTIGDTSMVDIILRAIPAVSRIHMRGNQGLPLTNAQVQIMPSGVTATTDSLGNVLFDSIPPGSYSILFTHPLHRADSLTKMYLPATQYDDTVSLRPVPAKLGVEALSTDSLPLIGASVSLSPGGFSFLTDSLGVVVIDSLDPQQYSLSIDAGTQYHYALDSINPLPADSLHLQYQLSYRPASLVVRVIQPDSLPLANATISIQRDSLSLLTDSGGYVRIDSLDRGLVSIVASRAGYLTDSLNLLLVAGSTDSVTIILSPIPGSLSVTVYRDNASYLLSSSQSGAGESGEENSLSVIANVFVYLGHAGSVIDSAATDLSGIALFSLPAGSYDIFSRPYGFAPSDTSMIILTSGGTIDTSLILIPLCAYMPGDLDLDQSVDIADLTLLVDHLFISFTPLPDMEHANLDASSDQSIDVGDLTLLVSHLFIDFDIIPCLEYLTP